MAQQYLNTRQCPSPHTLSFLQRLIQAPSVTPDDAGLITWLSNELAMLGFDIELVCRNEVKNLVAVRRFGDGPAFGFAGHVDVVPAAGGQWRVEPFSGAVIDGAIYGRGSCDMKGGIAAMLSATQFLVDLHEQQPMNGTFYWLITSDEEGEAEDGSKRIAQYLAQQNIVLDACLVGEPTSELKVGDTIKNGRRGALSGRVTVKGKAGHVAYPQNTINAAHLAAQITVQLATLSWEHDKAGSSTTLQVTGLNVPNVVDNLVPSRCEIRFNVRYGHGYSGENVISCINNALVEFQDLIELNWERPCEPYYTGSEGANSFLGLVEHSIFQCTSQYPQLSTAGGTSDGRFFANGVTQVVELGVRNHTIHQVNEHLPLEDLELIEKLYRQILINYFS